MQKFIKYTFFIIFTTIAVIISIITITLLGLTFYEVDLDDGIFMTFIYADIFSFFTWNNLIDMTFSLLENLYALAYYIADLFMSLCNMLAWFAGLLWFDEYMILFHKLPLHLTKIGILWDQYMHLTLSPRNANFFPTLHSYQATAVQYLEQLDKLFSHIKSIQDALSIYFHHLPSWFTGTLNSINEAREKLIYIINNPPSPPEPAMALPGSVIVVAGFFAVTVLAISILVHWVYLN